jgi:hypothetical protein
LEKRKYRQAKEGNCNSGNAKPETVLKNFQDSFSKHDSRALGLGLQNLENKILLLDAGGRPDIKFPGQLVKLIDFEPLQTGDIKGFLSRLRLRNLNVQRIVVIIGAVGWTVWRRVFGFLY